MKGLGFGLFSYKADFLKKLMNERRLSFNEMAFIHNN